MESSPLKGKKAVLLGDGIIRIYHGRHDFTDYNLLHNDLQIIIDDDDHKVFEREEEYYIDHSDATLGYSDND